MRSGATPPVTATRRPVLEPLSPTPPAARIQQAVSGHSLITRPASATAPTVTTRSRTTLPAVTTSRWALQRVSISPRAVIISISVMLVWLEKPTGFALAQGERRRRLLLLGLQAPLCPEA